MTELRKVKRRKQGHPRSKATGGIYGWCTEQSTKSGYPVPSVALAVAVGWGRNAARAADDKG